jgi:RHS repeat-associated protein
MEELVNGAVARSYTYGLDRISENQLVNGAWAASFYGVDGMDSVRQLTNSSGTPTDTYEYDAFGNMVSKTGPSENTYTPNNYLYRGEQYDPDLGLYYLRARYYNPVTGRFLSADPLASDGQRRYQYAGADPVNGTDPSGDFVLESYRPLIPIPVIIHPFSWCLPGSNKPMAGFLPPCPVLPPPPCKNNLCQEVTVSFWPQAADGFGHVGVGVDSPMFNEFTWGFATLNPKSHLKERTCWNEAGKVKHDQDTYPLSGVDYMRIPTDAAGADAMQQAIVNRIDNPGSYNVCARNCAIFVEGVLRQGGIAGVPAFEILPRKLWGDLVNDGYFWYAWMNP